MAGFGAFLGGLGGGTIGASVVSLILDTRRFDQGLATSKAKLTTSTAQMGASTSRFAAVAQTAYLAAATAAAAFVVSSVKAAIEAEEAQTKLANSIENSATVSGEAAGRFTEQADALLRLTGADDEAIIGAQSLLVQMGLAEDQVTRLTPLVVDLSAKMGVDMTTAARAVGRAVNGTTTGLSRMGVVVDKTQAAVDPYVATLDALAVAQGFAAEKAEDQPWILLQAQFEELSEEVGKVFLPLLQQTAEQLLAIVDPIVKGIDAIDRYGEAHPVAAENIGIFIDAVQGIPKYGNPALEVFTKLTGFGEPVAVSLASIGSSTEEVTEMFQHFTPEAYDVARAFGILGDKADATRQDIQQFGLTKKAIREWRKATIDDLREASLKIGGLGDDWRQTARETIQGTRRMARQAREFAADMDVLADIKAPATFKAWLVEQGPGWVSGFVNATNEGRRQIVGYWDDAADAVHDQKSVLDEVIAKFGNVKTAVDNLPDRKVINVHLQLTHSSDPGFPAGIGAEIAAALSGELVRGQR